MNEENQVQDNEVHTKTESIQDEQVHTKTEPMSERERIMGATLLVCYGYFRAKGDHIMSSLVETAIPSEQAPNFEPKQ